jgi:hypothetical protein
MHVTLWVVKVLVCNAGKTLNGCSADLHGTWKALFCYAGGAHGILGGVASESPPAVWHNVANILAQCAGMALHPECCALRSSGSGWFCKTVLVLLGCQLEGVFYSSMLAPSRC